MDNELITDDTCKLDNKRSELYTIEECYKKVGRFPFTTMKMKTTTPKPGHNFCRPLFDTVTILGRCLGPEGVEGWDMENDPDSCLMDSRSWVLLSGK